MTTLASAIFIATLLRAECLPVHGEYIHASDLAPTIPSFANGGVQVVAPAPLAGAQRRFSAAELLRVARRLGLPEPPAQELPESICLAYPTQPLTAERITAAIGRAAGPAGSFEVTEFSLFPVPAGELVFPAAVLRPNRRDGTTLLRGSVVYAPHRHMPIWARVKPLGRSRVLVAALNLAAGAPLSLTDVQMADADRPLAAALSSPVEIEGMMLRRTIAAGTPLVRGMLAPCRDIDPGQTVQVRVRAGSAQIAFESKAETGGYAGDRILLRNSVSGQRFRGTVEGRARVLVELRGKEQ